MENNIINQKTIRVLEKYKRENSKISIYLKELNGKTLMGYNETLKVNSASCIKVPIMLANKLNYWDIGIVGVSNS